MPACTISPYGSWPSPVSSVDVASGDVRRSQPQRDGDDMYWLERRPSEGGRTVVVRFRDGRVQDRTPADMSVRSRVHEYGGGAYRIFDGDALFSNDTDNGLYLQTRDGHVRKVLADAGLRFADFDRCNQGPWIACVQEDHRESDHEPRNTIVAIDLASGTSRELIAGADFYAFPRFSSDGSRLAWISWSHPHMPWDETQLWVAEVGPGLRLSGVRPVAGQVGESILQPEWNDSGALYFLSDRSSWWNVYRLRDSVIEPVTTLEAEIGGPLWNLGSSWYGLDSHGRAVCIVNEGNRQWLGITDKTGSKLRAIELPHTTLSDIHVVGERAVLLAGSSMSATAVISVYLESGTSTAVSVADPDVLDRRYVSLPEAVVFPGANGEPAHGYFYRPHNPDYCGLPNDTAPLIVLCHGGPTGQTSTVFDLEVQFWTSRGFGILDVNYGGSTGYGRHYRERLTGMMGEVDVDDCVGGAAFLAGRGDADPARMVIRGGSAGGYLVLAALAFRNTFAAGASYYGIGDLVALMESTHKFESRYVEKLVAAYPEHIDLFRVRSPIHSADRITRPMILFHGLEDTVVPPAQADMMVQALQRLGIPYAHLTFEGEGHGFRRAETLRVCLDAELSFYGQILGFKPADVNDPVPIVTGHQGTVPAD